MSNADEESSGRRLLAGGAAFAGVPARRRPAQPARRPPIRAPRSRRACDNAGVAAKGIELLAHVNKPPGWFDPANPGDVRVPELRHGVPGQLRVRRQLQRLQHLRHLQPGGADAEDRRSSARAARATCRSTRTCCSCRSRRRARRRTARSTPAADADDALPRRPHLRHLEHRGAGAGRPGPDLPRLAHAHAGASEERRRTTSTSTSRARPACAPAAELAGCDAGAGDAARTRRSGGSRSSRSRSPRPRPPRSSASRACSRTRRPARVNGLQNAPQTPQHPSGIGLGPDAGHQLLPRHHGLREVRPRRRLLRGQRPADRHLRPGEPEAHRRRRRPAVRLLARRDVLQRRQEGLLHRRVGRRHGRALPRDRPAELGRERDLRDRQPQARVPQLLQAAGGADRPTENCVSHIPSLVPIPGRDIFVQAWYQGGASLVDFTDPTQARRRSATSTAARSARRALVLGGFWSTYWYNGAIYGSEIARGFDVVRPDADRRPDAGRDRLRQERTVKAERFNAQSQDADRRGRTAGRPAPVGGNVPATLSLTLGAPAQLRRVHAGRRADVRGRDDRQRDLDRR